MPFTTAQPITTQPITAQPITAQPSAPRSCRALALVVHLQTSLLTAPGTRACRGRGDRGQATTEYALVLLAAALVGLMVVAWATAGGGTERIGRLFDNIIDAVTDRL
jgi:hypothetical protein